jgi:selenium metabolism protein YedF
MRNDAETVIDARDYGCELPVTMVQAALSKVKSGVVEILVSGEDVLENLKRFARDNALSVDAEKTGSDWKVKITKGSDISESRVEEAAPEKIFLVISSDVLGKEEELGKILIKSFFESMRATGDYPHIIFFLNAGVKLTALDNEVLPILKELQENGVELLSCLTCLKYYGLESQLKAGSPGSMVQPVGAIRKYKMIWV